MKKNLYSIIYTFLYILSFIWEKAYQVRRFLYKYGFLKKRAFDVPIVSVGNLSFGGTGKTPFTLWLGEYLAQERKKVMILIRGYKGNLENSFGIIRSPYRLISNPYKYGDEPLLLARRLKSASIVIGKKRSDNLEYYFYKEQPDIVLLDDGHQYLQLNRNLNILLLDTSMSLESYKTAPLGYLREGLSALKDVDTIVFTQCDQVSSQKLDKFKTIGEFLYRRRLSIC